MVDRLFATYRHEGFFDEVVDADGGIRPHYRAVVERLERMTVEELAHRERLRDRAFRTQGITFAVYGEEDGIERTFPMDVVPRVIAPQEWARIERGLRQRVASLNHFLEDVYMGEAAIVEDGVVPRRLVPTAEGFRREARGVPMPLGARCVVAGIDFVRDAEGTYRVLEDNVQVRSGISYVLENRVAMTRILPGLFAERSSRWSPTRPCSSRP